MMAMLKLRCKMARIQNEEDVNKELDLKIETTDGEIRDANTRVKVIKEFKILVEKVFIDSNLEEYFSKTNTVEYTATSISCINMLAKKSIF